VVIHFSYFQERDILCRVVIPECEEGKEIPVLRFVLSYFNVLTSKQIDLEVIATVDRPHTVENVEVISRYF
jgi:hypothetical protein